MRKRIIITCMCLLFIGVAGCSVKDGFTNILTGDDPGTEMMIGAAKAATGVAGSFFPPIATIGGLLFGGLQLIRKWRSDKKSMASLHAINAVIQKVKRKEIVSAEDVKTTIAAVHSIWNVYPEIRKDLEKLWGKKAMPKIPDDAPVEVDHGLTPGRVIDTLPHSPTIES